MILRLLPFSTWTCSIAKNLYFKHYNKQKREFRGLRLIDLIGDIKINPEIPENLEKAFLEKAIKDTIESFPEPEKSIIELLKNSMIQINKTASNAHFNEAETDRN